MNVDRSFRPESVSHGHVTLVGQWEHSTIPRDFKSHDFMDLVRHAKRLMNRLPVSITWFIKKVKMLFEFSDRVNLILD